MRKFSDIIKSFTHKHQALFQGVPGPSPWYLRLNNSSIPGYEWREAGEGEGLSGKVVLHSPSGPVLIVDYYHYISVIEDSLLLIWYQPVAKQSPTLPVKILVLDPARLNVLNDTMQAICNGMKRDGIPLLYDGVPIANCELDSIVAGQPLHFEFPSPINRIQELLILCHSSGVNPDPNWKKWDLALLVAHPGESMYELYAQDWWNDAELDYGYQWITRVVRNPATGKIHGEGIRISPFVLDDSLRKLKR